MPTPTDADREAAKRPSQRHAVHDNKVHAFVLFNRLEASDRGGLRRSGQQGHREERLHSSTLTSRIIPASMWNSRWQWYAQRPSASAVTR